MYYLRKIGLTALLIAAGVASAALAAARESAPGVMLEEFVYESASFPSCHSATILELESGELLCSFFGGTAERDPDVEIYLARKPVGGAWSAPVSVADGVQSADKRLPTWNPVLFQRRSGDLMLFYKVGPSPKEWWGMVKTSADEGRTWSEAKRLPEGILGPIKNKPIQLANGVIVSGSSTEDRGWRVFVERSTDDGKSWTISGPLNDGEKIGAIQPTLLTHADGRIQMLCRTHDNETGRILESWSSDEGETWSPLEPTVLPNNNSGLDAVTLKDGRQLLVYNHATREQTGMGHKARGILNVAISPDGQQWNASLVLDHLDEPNKQFSYPAVIQTRDGLVHTVYTWHRERIKHVVLDPAKLPETPMVDGQWPVDGVSSLKAFHANEVADPAIGEFDREEMDAAITRARAEVKSFIAELSSPTGEHHAVKVPIVDGDEVEHFWIVDVTYNDGQFQGTINNDPQLVTNVRLGDTRMINESDISDWMFLRDGRMHGNYTLRPLLPSLPPQEAAKLRAILAEP